MIGTHTMRQSAAWQDSEKIHINGHALIYTVSSGIIYVRIPGGRTVAATTLQALGHKVEFPRVMRHQDFI